MKSVYTAIPLALLAAVAQAESHLSSQHKETRDLGYGGTDGGHDFLGESIEQGDVVGDTFDHDFFGNGFNHPKHDELEELSDDDDDIFNPGFTDSGHDEIDGINENIVINQVNSQEAQQATEGTYIAPEPEDPHGGAPPAEHGPEQLPPQQHSEPKQAPEPVPAPAPAHPPSASYHASAEPKPAHQEYATPGPAPAHPPSAPDHASAEPKPAHQEYATPGPAPAHPPSASYHASAEPKPAHQEYAAPTPAPVSAHDPAPPSVKPIAYPGPDSKGDGQEPPCPEAEDGTHHMPGGEDSEKHESPAASKDAPKPHPETYSEHEVPTGKGGTAYQPHPPAQEGHPQPHDNPDCPEDHGDFPEPHHDEKDHSHGAYPLPEEPEDDFDLFPVPDEDESEPEVSKPFPPGRQYGTPQAQAHVTPSSSSRSQVKATPAASSVRHASYQPPAHASASTSVPAKHTLSTTFTAATSIGEVPTPTAPGPSSTPLTFLGGAGFLAVPQGFTVAALGAFAFLL
jgi:hypothetical protein